MSVSDVERQIIAGRSLHPRFAHDVLVIAGPSGAGKSTFIRAMHTNTLPETIAARLPSGAENWQQLLCHKVRKRSVSEVLATTGPPEATGLILHFDTFSTYRLRFESFRHDPVWRFFETSGSLTIVSLEPNRDQLISQFHGRKSAGARRRGPLRTNFERYVRQPLRTIQKIALRRNLPSTLGLYEQHAPLDECYKSWLNDLRELKSNRPETIILRISPTQDWGYSIIPTSEDNLWSKGVS